MKLELTQGEANAIAELIDREVRTGGVQAAALYGPIARQMIEQAQQKQEQANGDDHGDD